jgi:hypothetical protein
MAYLIRSLINLYLNVCRCAATTWNAKLNKSLKMVSLLAKIVFMSKYLGSCSNETQYIKKVRRFPMNFDQDVN